MNEIEKLYENAGIEKKRMCEWICRGNEFCSTNCEHYESTKEFYPPFTAEKQLELIKWLGKLDMIEIMKTVGEDKAWIISSRYDISEGIYHYASRNKSFEEALARLINHLWQNLTSEEKEQIRGILK